MLLPHSLSHLSLPYPAPSLLSLPLSLPPLCLAAIDAVSVVKELQQELSQWFTLGFFLDVPMVELERIQQMYQSRKEGLIYMVDAWIKGGEASWPALVHALQTEGKYQLAKKIAKKYGKQECLYCVCICTYPFQITYKTCCNSLNRWPGLYLTESF